MGFGWTIKFLANALIAKYRADQPREPAGSERGGQFTGGGEGVIAYHGTGGMVPEFSTNFVGTGQGAQSYGWGLYFAEEPKVAEGYQKDLAKGPSKLRVKGEDVVDSAGFYSANLRNVMAYADRDKGLKETLEDMESRARMRPEESADILAAVERLKHTNFNDVTEYRGNLYTVSLSVRPDELLDLDKPLAQQGKPVLDALKKVGYAAGTIDYPTLKAAERRFNTKRVLDLAHEDIGIRESLREGYLAVKAGNQTQFREWFASHGRLLFPEKHNDSTGEWFYRDMCREKSTTGIFDQKSASQWLASIGIPGLRYLDEKSRFAEPVDSENIRRWQKQLDEAKTDDDRQFASDGLDRARTEANHLTRNIVMFDDSRIHITHVNGKDVRNRPAEIAKALEEIRKYSPSQPRDEDGRWTETGGGIVAYHGTPHMVDDFKTDKIGTGEGAQVYGWGLYFAGNQSVAEFYQNQVKDYAKIEAVNARLSELVRVMDADGAGEYGKFKSDAGRKAKEEYDGLMEEKLKAGNLYTVKLNVGTDELLDWDRKLSEQEDGVRRIIDSIPQLKTWRKNGDWSSATGQHLYEALARNLGDKSEADWNRGVYVDTKTPAIEFGHKAASDYLQSLGIPGLRYLDQGSRVVTGGKVIDVSKKDGKWTAKVKVSNRGGVGFTTPTDVFTTSKPYDTKAEAEAWAKRATETGTHNFVIWDDSRIIETHLNGKPLTKPEEIKKAMDEIRKYSPEQPREPAGGEHGGQFVRVVHGTTLTAAIDKIIDEGIKSGDYHNWDDSFLFNDRKKQVFVSTNWKEAAHFAEAASMRRKAAIGAMDEEEASVYRPVVVVAEIPKQEFDRLAKPDELLNANGMDSSFRLPEVKPEWITAVDDFEFPGEHIWQRAAVAKSDTIRVYLPTRADIAESLVGEEIRKDWDESKHPRNPAGSEKGGEFTSVPSGALATAKAVVGQFQRSVAAEYTKFSGMTVSELNAYSGFNGTKDAVWKQKMGIVPKPGSSEDLTLRFAQGDSRAIETITRRWSKCYRAAGAEDVRPEFRTQVQKTVAEFSSETNMRQIFDRFGRPSIVVSVTRPMMGGEKEDPFNTPSAQYMQGMGGGVINVFDNGKTWGAIKGGEAWGRYDKPYSVAAGDSTVSSGSLLAVLHHEYGHHVEQMLLDNGSDLHGEWRGIWVKYKEQYDADFKAASAGMKAYNAGAEKPSQDCGDVMKQRISLYSTDNEKEGFAETFVAVTGPDYARDKFPSLNWPLLEFMEKLVK